ncbi:MAG: dual specificity protein phosphatase family protein [Clostridia bacterium]|nr:dual specificity protein phosphatase family protein [Clostridia bacterium]
MTIKVLSRAKAVKLSYKELTGDKVIISISDPLNKKAGFNRNNRSVKEILYLSFDDIAGEPEEISLGNEHMTRDDAVKICRFINRWKDKVQTMWVQCEVGVSRSAGIALAIMEYFNMDTAQITENPQFNPNMLCYTLTKNAFDRSSDQ